MLWMPVTLRYREESNMVGVYENYVKSQTDLTDVFLGGGETTPEQATVNRETIIRNLGIDPANVSLDRQLELVGDHHFNVMGGKNENRTIAQPEAPPPPPEYATQESVDTLQQTIEDKNFSPSYSGGDSYSYTTADPVDYSRIQGFVGTPEVRDEEGNITTEATGIYAQQQMPTGLMSGQQDLMTGQQTLGTGQGVLAEGQTTLGEGQTQLAAGQQGIMGGQQVLGEGQQAIGGAIGVASENQPQTLFGGQMALGQGQAGITTGVQGLGRDLTNLTGNLSDFENAQRQYQLTAEGQRAQGREIGMTTRDQLEDQLRTVGAQTNQMAEQQAMARQQGMMARQQAPQVQQANQASQAAQIAGQNLRSFAPQGGGMMGPTGPVAVDPRDQVGFGPTRSPV